MGSRSRLRRQPFHPSARNARRHPIRSHQPLGSAYRYRRRRPAIHHYTTNTVANGPARSIYQGLNGYSGFEFFANDAYSHYHSLQPTISRRWGAGYFQAAYTFSRSTDATSTGNTAFNTAWDNQADLDDSRGLSDFDRTHRLVAVTSTPFRSPRTPPDCERAALKDWSVSGVTIFQSGLPFSIVDSLAGTAYDGVTTITTGASIAPGESLSMRLHGAAASQRRSTNYVNVCRFRSGSDHRRRRSGHWLRQSRPQRPARAVRAKLGFLNHQKFPYLGDGRFAIHHGFLQHLESSSVRESVLHRHREPLNVRRNTDPGEQPARHSILFEVRILNRPQGRPGPASRTQRSSGGNWRDLRQAARRARRRPQHVQDAGARSGACSRDCGLFEAADGRRSVARVVQGIGRHARGDAQQLRILRVVAFFSCETSRRDTRARSKLWITSKPARLRNAKNSGSGPPIACIARPMKLTMLLQWLHQEFHPSAQIIELLAIAAAFEFFPRFVSSLHIPTTPVPGEK